MEGVLRGGIYPSQAQFCADDRVRTLPSPETPQMGAVAIHIRGVRSHVKMDAIYENITKQTPFSAHPVQSLRILAGKSDRIDEELI